MKQYTSIALTILLSVVLKTSLAQTASLADAKWLLGKWENQTQRGKMVEEWTKANDSSYLGKSYLLTATDSVPLETISLKKKNGDLFYIPTVKGQNNEQAVEFKLTIFTNRSLVFENPAHDFPQKITYTLLDERSLIAEISGVVNGVERKRQFPMKKF